MAETLLQKEQRKKMFDSGRATVYIDCYVMKHRTIALALPLFAAAMLPAADIAYQKPPKEVMEVLNSATTPVLSISPTHTYALQGSPVRYPPLAELAEPMYRLAGIRINPATNGLHNATFNSSLMLRRIPEGAEIKVDFPPNGRLSGGSWSPDGSHFAFTNATPARHRNLGQLAKQPRVKTHKLPGAEAELEVFWRWWRRQRGGGGAGGSMQWMADGKHLLVQAVRTDRGVEPPAPRACLRDR